MTVCMYRDIHTLQPHIIDFTQRGCHTLRSQIFVFSKHIHVSEILVSVVNNYFLQQNESKCWS